MPLIEKFKGVIYRIFFPDDSIRKKYQTFKSLLELDSLGHSLMAKLEQIHDEGGSVDFCAVEKAYTELAQTIADMIERLRALAPSRYDALADVFRCIDASIRPMLTVSKDGRSIPHLLMLDEISGDSEKVVGGKAASLAIISRNLKLPIPPAFVITASTFWHFLESNQLEDKIDEILADVNPQSIPSLDAASKKIVAMLKESPLPPDLEEGIVDFFKRLTGSPGTAVALRSSAVAEDSEFSFAGQYRSVLNVGLEDLGEAYKEVIASKYSARALSYRISKELLDKQTPMAVLVVEMINAKASGILYTQDPVSSSDALKIYSVWGLADPLVKGHLSPDVIEIPRDKNPTVRKKEQGTQKQRAVLAADGPGTKLVDLEPEKENVISLDDDHAKQLAEWGMKLESYFGVAQDIEWCMDAEGRLYLLQARPLKLEEVQDVCEIGQIEPSNEVLLAKGEKAAAGKGTGEVVKIESHAELQKLSSGSVLVASNSSPEFARAIKKLSAIVTDFGSVAGHLASVAREHRVPTLVNTGEATQILQDGQTVTVDADRQKVFAGSVEGLDELSCRLEAGEFESPLQKRLRNMLKYISPLNLTDPRDAAFAPQNCKTVNDILRFAHEKAIAEIFSLGEEGRGRLRATQKLKSDIPITLRILNLSDGLHEQAPEKKHIDLEDLANPGLRALWRGLSHPSIDWSSLPPAFDWQEFDRVSAGIIDVESTLLASFALVSKDYLNINIRFGYHFVVIDSVCGNDADKNYISMRFEGGGGGSRGRRMRVRFLSEVLQQSGFEAYPQGDWIEAACRRLIRQDTEQKLSILGRLLGYTRLLDIRIRDLGELQELIDDFMEADPKIRVQ